MSRNQKEDIRGQLSDIQLRLFRKTDSARKEPLKNSENVFRTDSSSKTSSSALTMPLTMPSKGPDAKGNDMNFVVGLSENLLEECRRLAADNRRYKSRAKDATDELQEVKNQMLKLKKSYESLATKELSLKDKNWELESIVTNLRELNTLLDKTKAKLIQENQEKKEKMETLRKELDEMKTKHEHASKEFITLKNSSKSQIRELNDRIHNLNNENDTLHTRLEMNKSITTMRHESKLTAQEGTDTPLKAEALDHVLADSSDIHIADLKDLDSNLQLETLKVNLKKANSTITELRSAVSKLKAEATLMDSSEVNKQNQELLSTSPRKRDSKIPLHDNDTTQPEEWDNYLSGIEEQSSYNQGITSIKGDVLPHLDSDNDDDESLRETNLEEYAHARGLIVVGQKDYDTLRSEQLSTVSIEEFKKEASRRKFQIITQDEYISLTDEAKMRSKLHERGLVTIPQDQHAKLIKDQAAFDLPSIEYLKSMASSKHLELLPEAEYETLRLSQERLDNPLLTDVTSWANKLSCQIMPNQDHEKLQKDLQTLTQLAHEPSQEDIEKNALKYSLKLLKQDEYFKLLNPTKSTIQDAAEKIGFAILPMREHNMYTNPTESYAQEVAKKLDLAIINRTQLDDLLRISEHPSLEFLTKHSQDVNMKLLSLEKYEQITREIEAPSIAQLKEKAARLNYVISTRQEYEAAKASSENPSLSYLKEHVEKQGLVTLLKTEFATLFKKANDPSIKELQELASQKKHHVLPSCEHEAFLNKLDNPPISFLSEKAALTGHKLVKEKDYNEVHDLANSPSIEHIRTKAAALEHIVISKTGYDQLDDLAHRPKQDHLVKLVQDRGHSIVKSHELKDLEALAHTPSLGHLQDKLKNHGHQAVADDKLKCLQDAASEPSLDVMLKTASAMGHTIITVEEYDTISLDASRVKPMALKLSDMESALKTKLDKVDELAKAIDELRFTNSSLTEEIAQMKATNLSLNDDIVQLKATKKSLMEQVEMPTRPYLEQKSKKLGLEVVDAKDIIDMRQQTEQPSLDYLISKSLAMGYSMLPTTTFDELRAHKTSPTLEFLTAKAQDKNYHVIEKCEFDATKKLADEPTLEHLKAKALKLDHSLVGDQELASLNHVSNSLGTILFVRDLAEKLGQSLVSKEKYESLMRRATSPTEQELIEHATSHGAVLIKKVDYKRLKENLESPSIDTLKSHAQKQDMVVIDSEKLKSLERSVEEPPLEKSLEALKAHNYQGIKIPDLEKLQSTYEHPSVDFLKSKAAIRELELVPSAELANLQVLAHTPDILHLLEKLKTIGHVAVEESFYMELLALANNPSKEHLDEKLKSMNYSSIAQSDLESLRAPTLESIHRHAKTHGHVVVEKDKYRKVLERAHSPNAEMLSASAAKIGHTLVPISTMQKLKQSVEKPTRDELMAQCLRNLLVAIDATELEEMKQQINAPLLEKVVNDAKKLGLESVPVKEYWEMVDKIQNPTKDQLTSAAKHVNCSLIPTTTYDMLVQITTRPSFDQLKQLTAKGDYSIIEGTEYRELIRRAENPTDNELRSKATLMGLKLLSRESHEQLAHPSKTFLESEAEKMNCVLVDSDEYQILQSTASNPSSEFLNAQAEKNAFQLVDKKQYANMVSNLESPSEAVLKEKAQNLGLTVVPHDEFDALKDVAKHPTIDHLKDRASEQYHIVLSNDEHDRLQSQASKTAEALAEEQGMTLVSLVAYTKLLDEIEHPTLSQLLKKLDFLGQMAITKEAHEELKKKANKLLDERASESGLQLIAPTVMATLQSETETLALQSKASKEQILELETKNYELEIALADMKNDNELHTKAKEICLKKIVDLEDDFKRAQVALSAPTIAYLNEKALEHEMRLINVVELKELRDRNAMTLQELANEQNFVVVDSDEMSLLRRKAVAPTVAELEAHAAGKYLKVVPIEQWSNLLIHYEEPSLAFLKEKAMEAQHIVIGYQEYQELLNEKNETLENRAARQNKSAVDNEEYQRLQTLAEAPSLDHIHQKAGLHKHLVLHNDELEELRSTAAESLESRSAKEGKVLVSREHYDNLQDSIQNPSLSYLRAKAAGLDYELIHINELQTMTSALNEPTLEHLKAKAADQDMSLVRNNELESLESLASKSLEDRAKEKGCVILPVNELNALHAKTSKTLEEQAKEQNMKLLANDEYKNLKECSEKPSLDFITPYLAGMGMAVLTALSLKDLKSTAEESLDSKAAKSGKIVVDTKDYEQLKSKLESPDQGYLESQAGNAGYKLVLTGELDRLLDSDAETTEAKAHKQNKVLLDEEEYQDLLAPSVSKLADLAVERNYKLVPATEHAKLTQLSEESIEARAAREGMVLMGQSAHAELEERTKSLEQQIKEPSLELINQGATMHGLVAVKPEELDELKSKAAELIECRAEREEKAVLPRKEYDELLVRANKPSIEAIKSHASLNGLVAVSENDYESMLAQCEEPLEDKAAAQGKAVTTIEELEELHSHKKSPKQSFLREKTALLGLATLPVLELEALKERVTNPTHSDLAVMAAKHHMCVVPKADLDSLRQRADNPNLDQIIQCASVHGMSLIENYELLSLRDQIDNPGVSYLSDRAMRHGYVTVLATELDELRKQITNPSRTVLEEKTAEIGCAIVLQHDLASMRAQIEAPSYAHLQEKADALGQTLVSYENLEKLEVASNQTLESKAREAGLVTVTAADYEQLVRRPTEVESVTKLLDNPHDLQEVFKKKGFSVIPANQDKETNVQMMKATANENGYLVVPQDDPTDADIAYLSSWLEGKVLSTENKGGSRESFERFTDAESSFILSEEELQRSAEALGYTLVKVNDQDQTITHLPIEAPRRGSTLSEDTRDETLDEEDLRRIAKERNYLLVPRSSYIAPTVDLEPDVENVTVIPTTYFSKLTTHSEDNLSKVSEEAFEKYALERGYMRAELTTPPPTKVDEATSPLTHPSPDVFTPPATSRFSDKRRFSPAMSTSRSMSNISLLSIPRSIDASMRTADIFSMATNVSLTDTSMIPAITQVVIGEYLFKYYRRLGGLSAISETRHERYFWIHPYSLTLYWSTSNPVLGNPADVKTRAAAIVGVESVDDNNPLPTGLYHKSIIVRSQDRSIKITCPSRKRHNIWFNALRYLIHRNINEISFDNDDTVIREEAEGTTTPAAGPIFDTDDRHAFPRSTLTTSSQMIRSPSNRKLSRHFSTLRRNK